MDQNSCLRILLFTNRDSDNMGDKVIEKCDIALIQAVMKNIGITDYKIISHDANIVYRNNPDRFFENADIILLGGAPLFNYTYQNFYKRTIITIELAEKYNKPVIFSAIGIDNYSEDNIKCQQLKKALNSDCVCQITTRDGYDFLKQYKSRKELAISQVADPAVWTFKVFENFRREKADEKKKIGIFVIRAEGFTDNGINFTKEEMVDLYKQLAFELESKGYDYEFLTSGHFSDEAFMDFMIRWEGADSKKCIFNINTPERLIEKISTYDGLISCRLHPSIIAYSLGVPSIGIVWNSKVEGFYNSVGYDNRVVHVDNINAADIAARMGQAIQEGVHVTEDYLMSVYQSLFNGINLALDSQGLKERATAYNYNELLQNIPKYEGMPEAENEKNLKRKFRRAYKSLNNLTIGYYNIIYNCGVSSLDVTCDFDQSAGEIKKMESGSIEYWYNDWLRNDGTAQLLKNKFAISNFSFCGWHIRLKMENNVWLWCLEDGSFIPKDDWTPYSKNKKLFADQEVLPDFPIGNITLVVAEAVWRRENIDILYNSGIRTVTSEYTKEDGNVRRLLSGTCELTPTDPILNDGNNNFKKNKFHSQNHQFIGWKLRIRINQQWFWYLSNGTITPKDDYNERETGFGVKVFADEANIPCIMNKNANLIVADAVWESKKQAKSLSKKLHLKHFR